MANGADKLHVTTAVGLHVAEARTEGVPTLVTTAWVEGPDGSLGLQTTGAVSREPGLDDGRVAAQMLGLGRVGAERAMGVPSSARDAAQLAIMTSAG